MRLSVAVLLTILATVAAKEEHFIDVKELVKDTIAAVARLPDAALTGSPQTESTTTKRPDDLYNLFRIPADIMTNLAMGAGYMDEPTTSTKRPWIVTKTHSEEDERGFKQDQSWEEIKSHKSRRDPTDGLLALSDLLPKPMGSAPAFPQNQILTQLPMIQPDHLTNNQLPRYAYKPVVQPDGQTYYIPVVLPVEQVSQQVPMQHQPMMDTPTVAPERTIITLSSTPPTFLPVTFPPMFNPFPPMMPSVSGEASHNSFVTPRPDPQVVTPGMSTISPQLRNTEPSVAKTVYEEVATPANFVSKRKTSLKINNNISKSMPNQEMQEEPMQQEKPQYYEEEKNQVAIPKKKKKKHVKKVEPEVNETEEAVPPKAEPAPEEFMEEMQSIPSDSEELELHHRSSRKSRIHASKTFTMPSDRKKEKTMTSSEEDDAPIREIVQKELRRLDSSEEEENVDEPKEKKVKKVKKSKKHTTKCYRNILDLQKNSPLEDDQQAKDSKTESHYLRHEKHFKHRHSHKKHKKSKKTVPSRQHCLNIRSFSKQFSYDNMYEFAEERCEFIENYYPELKCENVRDYMEKCHSNLLHE